MSGHSKWSTIKHQKAIKDQKRGQLFSKLAKAISAASEAGGDSNPESNHRLRLAIDQAKQANMPKENIERAVAKTSAISPMLEEVIYEGFAPGGVGLILEAETDNKKRTAQELKHVLAKGGGVLAVPGAVSFNFETWGHILIRKGNLDSQILRLIDLGAQAVNDKNEGLEVLISKENFVAFQKKIEDAGFVIKRSGIIRKPKSLIDIDPNSKNSLTSLIDALNNLSDIKEIYSNTSL